MRGIFRFFEGIWLFSLAYRFSLWYVGNHFSKYFIIFWLNTIIAIIMFVSAQTKTETKYTGKTGAEIWEMKH